MTTYKLTTEKEIRDMLEQSLMVEEARTFYSRLALFFEQKTEDLIDLFTDIDAYGEDSSEVEKTRNRLYKRYGIEGDAYDLEDAFNAFNDMRAASNYAGRIDNVINQIVKEELENPSFIEMGDCDENDEDFAEMQAQAHIDLESEFLNKYCAEIAPAAVSDLYRHSYGIDKSFEEELHEFIKLHLI